MSCPHCFGEHPDIKIPYCPVRPCAECRKEKITCYHNLGLSSWVVDKLDIVKPDKESNDE